MMPANQMFCNQRRISSTFQYVLLMILVGLQLSTTHAQKASQGLEPTNRDQNGETQRTWQFGGYAMGGFPPFYEVHTNPYHFSEELRFYSATFEAGKTVTALHGNTVLRGKGEVVVEIVPLWIASYPKQVLVERSGDSPGESFANFGPYVVHGISITPLLFRWNFMQNRDDRFVPWAQLGSGLLWTAHDFPPNVGNGLSTSRINFTPQVDFGESIFTRRRQSLNLGVRAVHMSSAGLGEYNPGINVSVQFTVGYSWWK